MKPRDPLSDEEVMRDLLKEWKLSTPLPPRFEEQVWRRIEREEAHPAPAQTLGKALRNWIGNWLPRPALALAYCSVLLVAGAGIGWTQARHESARVNTQLSLRYVKSVDPYQTQP